MKTKIFVICGIIILVVALISVFYAYNKKPVLEQGPEQPEPVFDPLNASYLIEGETVELIGGRSEKEISPESAAKIMTMAWGGPVPGDLNKDGSEDAALIITQNTGGSGTFYYIAASLNKGKAWGTNAIFLGDRILPVNIYIQDQKITVMYKQRKEEEPMTVLPSVDVTREFKLDPEGKLKEINPLEQACLDSGGTINQALCCESTEDFPNLCLMGPCGCSPENSHLVKICDCGQEKCFDQEKCLSLPEK